MFLFVVFVLLFLAILGKSMSLLNFIIDYGASATAILPLFLFLMPSLISVMMPFACAVAVIYVYHQLEVNSELTVMRASGLSNMRLARPMFVMSGALVLLGILLSFYIVPMSHSMFRDLRHDLRQNAAYVPIREGRFVGLGDNVIIYVPKKDREGAVSQLFIHDNREKEYPVTIVAQKGNLIRTEHGIRLRLIEGSRQRLSREHLVLETLDFEEYDMLLYSTDYQRRQVKKPTEYTFHELFSPPSKKQDALFSVERHKRLLDSSRIFLYALIAVVFMLTAHHSRRYNKKPILAAVICIALAQFGLIASYYWAYRFLWVIAIPYVLWLVIVGGLLYHLRYPERTSAWADAVYRWHKDIYGAVARWLVKRGVMGMARR